MVKPHGLFNKNLNAKQLKVIERTITTNAYGQASLGISSVNNVIVAVQTTNHIVSIMVENTTVYNYWVMIRQSNSAGTPVTNTSLKLSIVYYTL